jgi:CHASE1-domain containing sensor protein
MGMIAAAGHIPTRHEWQLYVDSLNLPRDNAGVLGEGLALRVAPADKAAHIAASRAQGLPGYRIGPEGERPVYVPVACLEPMTEDARHTLGSDMYAEAVTRAAMQSPTDSGRVAISGRLPSASPGEQRANFMMYVPV